MNNCSLGCLNVISVISEEVVLLGLHVIIFQTTVDVLDNYVGCAGLLESVDIVGLTPATCSHLLFESMFKPDTDVVMPVIRARFFWSVFR